ncbi:unnamed protein product [Linum trigynum]|uniref:Uncharacterized protein n=1 Tax=Linum trigynum TaxID=586398 RepID=A0AAV2DIE8_9ROSI
MEIKSSTRPPVSNSYGSAAASFEDLLMQQKLLFSANLQELKSLRKQLYTAAAQFEQSYSNEVQKEILTDTCKDYTIKALINTIDHLGSVAYKVNSFLDQTANEVAAVELRFYSLEQRAKTWQHYINRGGIYQHSLAFKAPKHHKQYIIPEDAKEAAEWEGESVTTEENEAHCSRSSSSLELNFHRLTNAVRKKINGNSPSTFLREGNSQFKYSEGSARQPKLAFLWSSTSTIDSNKKRADSPQQHPLLRSRSLYLKRSISPNYANGKQRNPSAPRRLVSWPEQRGIDGGKNENEQQSSKSKRLFRAMVSLRGTRKDNDSIHKQLDEI